MRKPKIGDIVIYRMTEAQQKAAGGNHDPAYGGRKEVPCIIVAVWGDDPASVCNLRSFNDSESNPSWITSVPQGEAEGTFFYAE